MTANFYGLNHNLKIADGEWYDMENLTSDHLPVAAVRKKRDRMQIEWLPEQPVAVMARPNETNGIPEPIWIEKDGWMRFPMSKYSVDLKQFGYNSTVDHSIVMMGANAVILPELIYVNVYVYNPQGYGMVGSVRRKTVYTQQMYEGSALEYHYYMSMTVCDYEGLYPTFVQAQQPENNDDQQIKNGDTWFKTGSNYGLYRYDETSQEWYTITQHIKFQLAHDVRTSTEEIKRYKTNFNVPGGITAGDVLSIEGSSLGTQYPNITGNKMVVGGDQNQFWVAGSINSYGTAVWTTEKGSFSIGRAVPEMDYVIEAGNRLWGCRFLQRGQETLNEIYCSERGNFFKWIAGPSDNDDSAVTFSVGEGGRFTGAVNFNGTPIFFKENRMIRVDGFGASGFSLNDAACAGVGLGSNNSPVMVNNVLYYKSERAIMRYDGSVPVPVSENLGELGGCTGEEAGAVGNKYCIQLVDRLRGRYIAVLDTIKGVWTKETKLNGLWAQAQDEVYVISAGKIETLREQNSENFEQSEETVRWYAESGIIGLETPDEKYITRLAIRLKLEAGAHVRVLIQYDSSGEWEQVMAAEFVGMRTVAVPVHPHKYDHMRYRLEGEGDCQIFSVTKTLERAGRR
jgi:hypothetical protein